MWALVENGIIKAQYRTPRALTINGVQYPENVFTVWSDAQLKTLGIYRVVNETSGTGSRFTDSSVTITYDSETDRVVRTTTYKDKPVAQLRDMVKLDVNSIRDQKLKEGAAVTIANTAITIQTRNEQDMANINGTASLAITAVMAGQANTFIPYRDADDILHIFTAEQALDMTKQVHARLYRHYEHSWNIKDSLGSMTKTQIKALDLEGDWPETP